MDTTTTIGVIGAGLILIAFAMNQTRRWSTESMQYDVVNLVGSLLLLIYAYLLDSYPFMILNGIWLLVSVRDMVAYLRR